jgi:hypothetical protein
MFNIQMIVFIEHNTSEANDKVLCALKLFQQDAYENYSATSGDVSSIFHVSHEVCLILAYYYVTMGLTLIIPDIIKRDKIVNVQKPTFLAVSANLAQCFSLFLQHHQTNHASLLPHISYNLTPPANKLQVRINSN